MPNVVEKCFEKIKWADSSGMIPVKVDLNLNAINNDETRKMSKTATKTIFVLFVCHIFFTWFTLTI